MKHQKKSVHFVGSGASLPQGLGPKRRRLDRYGIVPAVFSSITALLALSLAGCSSSESSETGGIRTLEQDVLVKPTGFTVLGGGAQLTSTTLSLPPGAIAGFSLPFPEDGLYTVTYDVLSTASGASPIPTLQFFEYDVTPNPATDQVLGGVSIPEHQEGRSNTRVSHNVTLTRDGSGNDQIYIYNSGTSPSSETIDIITLTIAPLRTSSRADQATNSFLSAGTADCSGCHGEQWNQWRSSMMGYSSISPPIHTLELTENHVGPSTMAPGLGVARPTYGRFARSSSASLTESYTQSASSLFCQRCHAPSATFTDVMRVFRLQDDQGTSIYNDANRGQIPDSHRLLTMLLQDLTNNGAGRTATFTDLLRDDPNVAGKLLDHLDPTEIKDIKNSAFAGTEGVTCAVCHSINGIEAGTAVQVGPNEAGVANAAFRVVHNSGNELRLNFGPYLDTEVGAYCHPADQMGTDGQVTGTDGVERPFIQSSQLCGTCHDVRIGAHDVGADGIPNTPDDAGPESDVRRVENLFTEWRNSPWNNNGIPYTVASGSVLANPNVLATSATTPDGTRSGTLIGGGVKASTSCQDCHMSKYGTHDDALPGQYDIGSILYGIGQQGTNPPVRRSNHRFMGVDRFLTHALPDSDGTVDPEGLANYDVSNGLVALSNSFIGDFGPSSSTRDLRETLLQKAVDFKIEHVGKVEGTGATAVLPVRISVENIGAGHNIPAGLSQERQVFIELEVLDVNGNHVYTSGYLSPLNNVSHLRADGSTDSTTAHSYLKAGSVKYSDSFCGKNNGEFEWLCELDGFRADLGPFLNIMSLDQSSSFLDLDLRNYQNGFSYQGNKVFTQFIGDHINNANALKPFVKNLERYRIPVGTSPGPFTVSARLRFRPLPLEFLETLMHAFESPPAGGFTSRIDETVLEKNKVIEMASDYCRTGNTGAFMSGRSCNNLEETPVALGFQHTCFVLDGLESEGPSLQCFGDNGRDQVGIGFGPTAVELPRILPPIDVTRVSLGMQHSCAVHADGTVSCWGAGDFGQLADKNTGDHQVAGPRKVDTSDLSNVTRLASADNSSCAIIVGAQTPDPNDVEETVKCWGSNASGQLGAGFFNPVELGVPTQLSSNLLPKPEAITGGAAHYCAIVADSNSIRGTVKCWGAAVGTGYTDTNATPRPVTLPYRTTEVGAGENFSCALLQTGDVYCWGANDRGQLGRGGALSASEITPAKVQLLDGVTPLKASHIAVGRNHACAVTDEGVQSPRMMCWGEGDNGRLGWSDTDFSDQSAPRFVLIDDGNQVNQLAGVQFAAAGGHHTCADSSGALGTVSGRYCWGDNSKGQSGRGGFGDHLPSAGAVTPTDPSGTGRTYWAPTSKGGPGTAACSGPSICKDEIQWVDTNSGNGFEYNIEVDQAGSTDLFFRVAMLPGQTSRTMNLFVNNVATNIAVTQLAALAPRPQNSSQIGGAETGPFTVNLVRGKNAIRLQDNGPSDEFDMIYLRVRPSSSASCSDHIMNQDETDQDCGGSICQACGVNFGCEGNIDCSSGLCVDNMCAASPCNLSVATDLGAYGTQTTVKSDACLKVTAYPVWWDTRPLKLQRQHGTGTTIMNYNWDNRGGGVCDARAIGSGSFANIDDNEHYFGNAAEGSISENCATLIKLQGSSATNIMVTWYP